MGHCDLSLVGFNPQPIGILVIFTLLIRPVNHVTGKFSPFSNSQSKQFLAFDGYWRVTGGVDTSKSKEILRLGT